MRDVYYKVITNQNIKRVIKSPKQKHFELSTTEVLTLRLLTHDYSKAQILNFLELSSGNYTSLLKSIRSELRCANMFDVQLQALRSGILKREDYVPQIVKDEALVYSKMIFYKLKDEVISKEQINALVLLFFNSCKYNLKEQKNVSLTAQEQNVLELSFKKIAKTHIEKELNISRSKLASLQKDILDKCGVNNWCNVYKKAFELELLTGLPEDHMTLNSQVVMQTSNKIAELSAHHVLDKEKELAVFQELLNFYATIELSFFSQN